MKQLFNKKATFGFLFAIGLGTSLSAQWQLTGNAITNPTTQFIGTTTNQPLVFRTNNTEKMRVTPTGNVGIGTNNPFNNLHIHNGAIRLTGLNPGTNTSPSGGAQVIWGYTNDNVAEVTNNGQWGIEYIAKGEQGNALGGLNFWKPWPTVNWANYYMFLSNSGRIGMGTNKVDCTDCSTYRLFVKDGIRTEKVKVDIASVNGWADFVFKDGYNLMPLEKVEAFIKENQHLPEIPSEKQVVEQGGIELKEMNVKLLQKIEELTLHLIEQNKRIKELENKQK